MTSQMAIRSKEALDIIFTLSYRLFQDITRFPDVQEEVRNRQLVNDEVTDDGIL